MLRTVVLTVANIVVLRPAMDEARIVAVGRALAARGIDPTAFSGQASERLGTSRRRAWVARSLGDAGVNLTRAEVRQMVLTAREATPPRPEPQGAEALRRLGGLHRLVFLDWGHPPALDAWRADSLVTAIPHQFLWAARLGAQAGMARTLAFRWLQERLNTPADECLMVTTEESCARSAERSGWSAWRARSTREPAAATTELESVVAWLEDKLEESNHSA